MAQYKIRKRAGAATSIAEGVSERTGISGAVKHFGLEATESFSAAAFKDAAEEIAAKEILPVIRPGVENKVFFENLLEKSTQTESKEISNALATSFKTKITADTENNILKIAKEICTEFANNGIKLSESKVAEIVAAQKAKEILVKLSENATDEAIETAIKGLSNEEATILQQGTKYLTGEGTDNATKEAAKKIFSHILAKSPTYERALIAGFRSAVVWPKLGNWLSSIAQFTVDPMGALAKKCGSNGIVGKFVTRHPTLRFLTGVFATTTTLSVLVNSWNRTTNFNNIEVIVKSIKENLSSYSFDAQWPKFVNVISRRLDEGVSRYNQAQLQKFTSNDNPEAAAAKVKNKIEGSATGEEILNFTFNLLLSNEFSNLFTKLSQAGGTTDRVIDIAADVLENMSPATLRNIEIVRDAARAGLQLVNVDSKQMETLIYELNSAMTADENKAGSQPSEVDALFANDPNKPAKNPAVKNQFSLPHDFKLPDTTGVTYILNNFIKVAKILGL
ncbi:MAG: hypothetical protein ACOYMA_00120 [Bacteroidia bacterium]